MSSNLGDDAHSLVWDISGGSAKPIDDPYLVYRGEGPINQVAWSVANPEWVRATAGGREHPCWRASLMGALLLPLLRAIPDGAHIRQRGPNTARVKATPNLASRAV